jgi:outer membrane protein assembly factor BamE
MLTKLMTSFNAVRFLTTVIFALSLLSLGGCSYYKFPWVYRINIEQGNIVDEDKLAQVKVGMSKSQVKFLLGSPLIVDTFNQSRWDYYYSFRTGKGKFDRARVTLNFSGESLASLDKKEYETMKLRY